MKSKLFKRLVLFSIVFVLLATAAMANAASPQQDDAKEIQRKKDYIAQVNTALKDPTNPKNHAMFKTAYNLISGTPTDPFEEKENQIIKSCKRGSLDMISRFYTIQDLIDLMSLTPTGKSLATQYERRADRERLLVVPLSKRALSQILDMDRQDKNGTRYGGFFDSDQKTIYLDKEMQMGLALITFAHELAHAFDDQSNQEMIVLKNQLDTLNKQSICKAGANRAEVKECDDKTEAIFKEGRRVGAAGENRVYPIEKEFVYELQKVIPCFATYRAQRKIVDGKEMGENPNIPNSVAR
jgi:hypothetical protein